MRYLGITPNKIKIAVFDFTSCEGCELQLANKEDSLHHFLDLIEVVDFREVSSAHGDDYDVALIEGAITRADEVERLTRVRARAKTLVALGACACFGGVARQKNAYDLDEANRIVYGDHPKPTTTVRAVHEVVAVDLAIPGCPVSKREVERIVQHLVWGVPFRFPRHPVCVECKQRFVTCAFDRGQLCLGPITRGGCDAPCPAGGLACWGCRGPSDEANVDEFCRIALDRGFSTTELGERLGFFGGFTAQPPATRMGSPEHEVSA
ncbi:MAG: NADH:ubiquinone oxidoreductase [Pseudomonadota bacterium]